MLGYGLMGGVFGGGDSLSRINSNPFTNNMVRNGSGISSANTGQNNATASDASTPPSGQSPFADDGYWNGEMFSGPGENREPFSASWRKSLGFLWKNRRAPKPKTTATTPTPTGVGPLASSMQSAPMQPSTFNNPFTYF